jgi:coatomer subunit beta'
LLHFFTFFYILLHFFIFFFYKGQNNISFLSYFVLGKLDECLQLLIDTSRLPEAAFFARTYLPSKVSSIVALWREELHKTSVKAAQALADPEQYENLFSNYRQSLRAEQFLATENSIRLPASEYPRITVSLNLTLEHICPTLRSDA